MDWPVGASPLVLAAGMLLGAAAWIALGLVAASSFAGLATLTGAPFVVAAQIVVSAVTFVLFFRLQRVAGPVYLSQIGYVITATGLLSGMVLSGESYPLLVWLAVALIAAGVVLTTRAQR
jgi:drug/metabolite transporter (DMT)-like permease